MLKPAASDQIMLLSGIIGTQPNIYDTTAQILNDVTIRRNKSQNSIENMTFNMFIEMRRNN